MIWLCGWTIGEAFALWILGTGALALLTGRPLPGASGPLEPAPALMAGLFLLIWLPLWSLGGYLAMREMLRVLWSEDRIVARGDALVVHRKLGPFRSTTTIPRLEVLRIYALPRKRRLMAETPAGSIELTSLGGGAEAEALAAAFREEMRLKEDASRAAASLPEGWREVPDAEGGLVLVKDEDQRRTRGRVSWLLTVILAGVAVSLSTYASRHADTWPLAGAMTALTTALAWGSWRTSHTRLEWRIDPGRLRLRRRSTRSVKELFEGDSLELAETSDSDGDDWFTLYAVAAKRRRKIAQTMDDPTVPHRLGSWLAARANVRLLDRTTAEQKKLDLAELIARLEAGGGFSRWMARHIPRR